MYSSPELDPQSKPRFYARLARETEALLADEHNQVANAANFAALVWQHVPSINWCGFYFFDGQELVVGPFQGRPACVRIALRQGVCGTAAATLETQLVADVHAVPGHIACDAASRSELVVPLRHVDGSLLGVWDVDAPVPGRFDTEDRQGMEKLAEVFLASLRCSARDGVVGSQRSIHSK